MTRRRMLPILFIALLLAVFLTACDLTATPPDETTASCQHTDVDGDRTCDGCGEQVGSHLHDHTYGSGWEHNEMWHWHPATCIHSDRRDSYAAHVPSSEVVIREATCGESGLKSYICSVCGYEGTVVIPALSHPLAEGFEYDASYHWRTSSCEHEWRGYSAPHTFDEGVTTREGTCLVKGEVTYTCTECGYQKTEETDFGPHLQATELSSDETHHYYAYICGHDLTPRKSAHRNLQVSLIPATCEERGERHMRCIDCEYESVRYIDPLGHTYATELSYDESTHWYAATCGHDIRKSEREHSYTIYLSCSCGYRNLPKDGLDYSVEREKTISVTGVLDPTLTEVTILKEWAGYPITAITAEAFAGNEAITSIVIPSSITSIEEGAFLGCTSLRSLTVDPENPIYMAVGNCLIRREDGTVVAGCRTSVIPDSTDVVAIGNGAFRGVTTDTPLVLGPHIERIGKGAFAECHATSITLSEHASLKIGEGAFLGCTADILWPKTNMTAIPEDAFSGALSARIDIPEGISVIGKRAFLGCTALEAIDFPASLYKVESYAFGRCTALTSLELPALRIGDYAFADCTGVATLTIASGTSSIGCYAFRGMSLVTELDVPYVSSIYYGAFSGFTSLTDLTVRGLRFYNEDGYHTPVIRTLFGERYETPPESIRRLTIIASDTLGQTGVFLCKGLEELTLDCPLEHETSVGSCEKLRKLTISSLEDHTLADVLGTGLGALREVVILKGETLADRAFYNYAGLTHVTLPSGMTAIGDKAFEKCRDLVSITLPATLKSVGTYAFLDTEADVHITDLAAFCGIAYTDRSSNPLWGNGVLYLNGTPLTGAVAIPTGVTEIAKYAFYGYDHFTAVSLPSSVKTIGTEAFANCSALIALDLSAGLRTIGDEAFRATPIFELILPDGVTTIGKNTFCDCPRLARVRVPASVTAIGARAFSGCKNLVEVYKLTDFTQNPTTPDEWLNYDYLTYYALAVHTDDAASSIILEDGGFLFLENEGRYEMLGHRAPPAVLTLPSDFGGQPYSIRDYAFYKAGLREVIFPASLSAIGYSAFASNHLTSLTLSGIPEIRGQAFAFNDLTELTLGEGLGNIGTRAFASNKFVSLPLPDGLTVHFDTGVFSDNDCLTEIVIPRGLITVCDEMFSSCEALTRVVLADDTVAIGNESFDGCVRLCEIVFGGAIKTIGDRAFAECRSLTSLTLPSTVTAIGDEAFTGSGLMSLSLYGGLDGSDSAFAYCRELTALHLLGSGVIGDRAFLGCTALTAVPWEKITVIGDEAFSGCTALTVVLTEPLRTIGDRAFSDCILNETVLVIPASVVSIGDEVFAGRSLIESVSFAGNQITAIGKRAFADLTKLTTITIPSGTETLGAGMLSGCYSLTSIRTPLPCGTASSRAKEYMLHNLFGETAYVGATEVTVKVTAVDTYLFYLPASLETVTITRTGGVLGQYALAGLGMLKNVYLPSDVKTVAYGAFSGCSKLTSLSLPSSVTAIASEAFYRCYLLSSINLPGNLTSIGSYAFAACRSLTEITLPQRLESIGEYAFYRTAIKTISIPASVSAIGAYAFTECEELKAISFMRTTGWTYRVNSSDQYLNVATPSQNAVNLTNEYAQYPLSNSIGKAS